MALSFGLPCSQTGRPSLTSTRIGQRVAHMPHMLKTECSGAVATPATLGAMAVVIVEIL